MDNISVAIRVRPLNSTENENSNLQFNDGFGWKIESNNITQYTPKGKLVPSYSYSFDHIFTPNDSTQLIYSNVCKGIIKSALIDGINGTIFAYGQTSSGKTHTMQGTKADPGIIPLAISDIFELIKSTPDREFTLRVSYMEIYNENIRDLLLPSDKAGKNSSNLRIREDKNGVFIRNLTEKTVTSPSQLFHIMDVGQGKRTTGATSVNDNSSRSHSIFKIMIESRSIDGSSNSSKVRISEVNLVDLAGSERASNTKAEGIRLKEGGHINKSLLTLSFVIGKLSNPLTSKGFIPYRNSKLTRILQPALGGNSLTTIICAITPSFLSIEETNSTLKFANRAKKIKNQPIINEISDDNLNSDLRSKEIFQENLKLKLEIEKLVSIISTQQQSDDHLRNENQQLKYEINHLKTQSPSSLSSPSLSSPDRHFPPNDVIDRKFNEFQSIITQLNQRIDELENKNLELAELLEENQSIDYEDDEKMEEEEEEEDSNKLLLENNLLVEEINKIQTDHELEIEQIKSNYESKIKEIISKYEEQIANHKTNLDLEMTNISENTEKTISKLEERISELELECQKQQWDLEVSSQHIHEYQNVLLLSKQQIDEYETLLPQMQNEFQTQLEYYQSQFDILKNDNEILQFRSNSYLSQINELQSQLQFQQNQLLLTVRDYDDKITSLEAQLLEANNKLSSSQITPSNNEKLQQKSQNSSEEIDRLQSKLDQLNVEYSHLLKEKAQNFDQSQKEIKNWQKESQQFQQQIKLLNDVIFQRDSEIQKKLGVIESLKLQNEQIREELEQKMTENAIIQSQSTDYLKKIKKQHLNKENEIQKSFEDKLTNTKLEIQNLQQMNQKLQEKIDIVDCQLVDKKNEILELKQNHDIEIQRLKSSIEKSQSTLLQNTKEKYSKLINDMKEKHNLDRKNYEKMRSQFLEESKEIQASIITMKSQYEAEIHRLLKENQSLKKKQKSVSASAISTSKSSKTKENNAENLENQRKVKSMTSSTTSTAPKSILKKTAEAATTAEKKNDIKEENKSNIGNNSSSQVDQKRKVVSRKSSVLPRKSVGNTTNFSLVFSEEKFDLEGEYDDGQEDLPVQYSDEDMDISL